MYQSIFSLRQIAAFLLPQHLFSMLSCVRQNRYIRSLHRKCNHTQISRKLFRAFNGIVQSGPFAGLRLPSSAIPYGIAPHLLGTYEHEIHEVFHFIRRNQYRKILNIGASFGYVALGLARLFPKTPVIAYEPDPYLRKILHEGTVLNRIKNLRVFPLCLPETLQTIDLSNSLIISDCEGYEARLFTDAVKLFLTTSSVLIELHEGKMPGITQTLSQLFANTHKLHTFTFSSREIQQFCFPPFLSLSERSSAVDELRNDGFTWLWVVPQQFQDI